MKMTNTLKQPTSLLILLPEWPRPTVAFLIVVLALAPFPALAGDPESPAPPDDPASAMFSLEAVFQRLATGAAGVKRGVGFVEPTAGPGSTGYTLDEVMSMCPVADNAAGALPGEVLAGKTYWSLRTDGTWGPQTGAIATQTLSDTTTAVHPGFYTATDLSTVDPDLSAGNVRAGVTVFGVAGDPNVVNTSAGDASASDVLAGKKAWVDGSEVTGTIATQTLSATTTAVAGGFYTGTDLTTVDPDLSSGNVRAGVTVFGVPGSVIQASGTAADAQVISGVTYSNAAGASIGTMPNIGMQNVTPGTSAQQILAGFHDGTGSVAGDTDLISGNIRGGVNLFGVDGDSNVVNTSSGDAMAADIVFGKKAWVAGSEVTGTGVGLARIALVEKTGQTECFDAAGSSISCAGTGQDGDLQKGVSWPGPRFIDNGDGTVTDVWTGLIWLKNANCFGVRKWKTALTDANTLVANSDPMNPMCGLRDGSVAGDWRLPNVKELRSLVHFGFHSPALSDAGAAFSGVSLNLPYWSSTTRLNEIFITFGVWVITFDDGGITSATQDSTLPVWPVRGGQ